MCLNTGTPKNINFSLETNGKLMALGVPILKHFRVCSFAASSTLFKMSMPYLEMNDGFTMSSFHTNMPSEKALQTAHILMFIGTLKTH